MSIVEVAGELLRFATSEVAGLDLAERRRRSVTMLSDLIGSPAGFWAWGHGHPYRSPSLPVAILDYGLDQDQRGVMMNIGLSAELDRYFRMPIANRMGDRSMETTISQQVSDVANRDNLPMLYAFMDQNGWTDWMHCVHYSAANNWSNLFLLRTHGPFDETHAQIVDFAMANIAWLQSTAHDYVTDQMLVGLTNRQQSVILLLLDGLPRKMIAKQLSLSEDTIGDHIKAIYQHFQVNSATELAALFLRGL